MYNVKLGLCAFSVEATFLALLYTVLSIVQYSTVHCMATCVCNCDTQKMLELWILVLNERSLILQL